MIHFEVRRKILVYLGIYDNTSICDTTRVETKDYEIFISKFISILRLYSIGFSHSNFIDISYFHCPGSKPGKLVFIKSVRNFHHFKADSIDRKSVV